MIDKALVVSLVTTQKEDLFSATQLWKMMGSVTHLRPKEYLKLDATHRFIRSEYPEIDVSAENHGLPVKRVDIHPFIPDSICKVFRGRNGGTYMEKKLLLDYAQWLSPEIKSLILETFIEYGHIAAEPNAERKMKKLVDKAFDAAPISSLNEPEKETVEDKLERLRRVEAAATRKAFTAAMESAAGVKMVDSPELRHFVAKITDELYITALGDNTKGLRKGLGLGKHTTPRDALNSDYLYSVTMTEKRIVRYLSKEGENATFEGVKQIIHETIARLRPLLEEVDMEEPAAKHVRHRKGSGFEKGEYVAHRQEGCLEYSLVDSSKRLVDNGPLFSR